MFGKDFNAVAEAQLDTCRQMLVGKGAEYAPGEDKLINFKLGAAINRSTPKETLLGYLTKHLVSVYEMVRSKEVYSYEKWDEKITDSINYLILLKALVVEESFPDNSIGEKGLNPLKGWGTQPRIGEDTDV